MGVHPYFEKEKHMKMFAPYFEVFGDKIFEIIKNYHPNLMGNHLIFDRDKLEKYLSYFKGYPIKETRLQFYMTDDFIVENWDPYLIIRDPYSVFKSIVNNFEFARLLSGKLGFIFRNRNIMLLFNKWGLNRDHQYAREVASIFINSKISVRRIESMTLEECFVVGWTVSNYYVVSRIDEDHILIYNKPETFKKLPFEIDISDFKLNFSKEFKEKYQYKFEKIAKEWDIIDEYEELLKLFD